MTPDFGLLFGVIRLDLVTFGGLRLTGRSPRVHSLIVHKTFSTPNPVLSCVHSLLCQQPSSVCYQGLITLEERHHHRGRSPWQRNAAPSALNSKFRSQSVWNWREGPAFVSCCFPFFLPKGETLFKGRGRGTRRTFPSPKMELGFAPWSRSHATHNAATPSRSQFRVPTLPPLEVCMYRG